MNLYAYCGNNPIKKPYSINLLKSTAKKQSLNNISFLSNSALSVNRANKNYWDVDWEDEWFDTDWPGFFVVSNEGFEIVNWGLSIYTGSLYLDHNKEHSLNISAGNIDVYAGFNFKKGVGIDASASVLQIGYDGRVLDASIEGLTIGVTYMFKNGKFKFRFGAGWFGWSVSIDLVELKNIIFGGN